jgi:hypothetical protein
MSVSLSAGNDECVYGPSTATGSAGQQGSMGVIKRASWRQVHELSRLAGTARAWRPRSGPTKGLLQRARGDPLGIFPGDDREVPALPEW